jgi:hypothetical protein
LFEGNFIIDPQEDVDEEVVEEPGQVIEIGSAKQVEDGPR